MTKRRILIQLDGDKHASVFDRVVAVDSEVEELFSYAQVDEADVQGLVHGAMFTRGPDDLKSTAIFIGGSDVAKAERLLEAVRKTFFGPLRCSVLMDANGANTTASAAVLAARRHVSLKGACVLVAGGTGPVGLRASLLLAKQGSQVLVASRSLERAKAACEQISAQYDRANLTPVTVTQAEDLKNHSIAVVIAAGAAGARLLSKEHLADQAALKVLIDLNAVPPSGIEGVEVTDSARKEAGVIHYGAIGVGGTKMKIHKAAIRKLFESNDQILDAEQVFEIGLELESD